MTDVVDSATRSRMMAGIQGKNTRPEVLIRKALFAQGFRYRLHHQGLPGKPDIVLPRYRAVILVNGCFWHLHDCHLFKWPSSRPEFWRTKLTANKERDQRTRLQLHESGWRTLVVWECALKGKHRLPFASLIATIADWLRGDSPHSEISGAVAHEPADG
jgi:DNA mismatch endonuclease, patch repair protein